MMNKKGEAGDLVKDNAIFLILLIIFFLGMLWYVYEQMNGAAIWGDYYAKELGKIIDFSEPGDEYWIDVHNAVVIAKKNKVGSFSEIFRIDNLKNEVCVKMSRGRRTCYSYFNDVDVADFELRLGLGENEVNRLYFKIVERQDNAEGGVNETS